MPLYDPAQHPGITDNAMFLKEHVGHSLLAAFKTLSQQQVINFVNGCFNGNMDLFAFKIISFYYMIKTFSFIFKQR